MSAQIDPKIGHCVLVSDPNVAGEKMRFMICLLLVSVIPGVDAMDPKVEKNEQRIALKFLVQSGKRPSECLRALQPVFGNKTMSETQVRFCHRRFKEGGPNTPTTDLPRPGRPRSSRTAGNISRVSTLLEDSCRRSVRELASEADLSQTVTFNILRKDLKLRKRAACLVPTFLSDTQKEVRAQLCDENLTRW